MPRIAQRAAAPAAAILVCLGAGALAQRRSRIQRIPIAHIRAAPLRLIWSWPGPLHWRDICAGPRAGTAGDAIYASRADGRVSILTTAGTPAGALQLDPSVRQVTPCVASGHHSAWLLAFGAGQTAVFGYSQTGALLWRYNPFGARTGVTWAAPSGTVPNGIDGAVVGYIGFGGVHLVSAAGRVLWKAPQYGGIQGVSATETGAVGGMVLAADSTGALLGFDARGQVRLNARPDNVTFRTIASFNLHNQTAWDIVALASKPDSDRELIYDMSVTGYVRWVRSLGLNLRETNARRLAMLRISPQQNLLAAVDSTGAIHLYTPDGLPLGVTRGLPPALAICSATEPNGDQILVAASDRGVFALRPTIGAAPVLRVRAIRRVRPVRRARRVRSRGRPLGLRHLRRLPP